MLPGTVLVLIALPWKLLPLPVSFNGNLCLFHRVAHLGICSLSYTPAEVFANGHAVFSESGYHVAFLLPSSLVNCSESSYLSSVAQMPPTSSGISVRKSPCCPLEPTVPFCRNDLQLPSSSLSCGEFISSYRQ